MTKKDWRWPKKGVKNPEKLGKYLQNLPCPYEDGKRVPMCYPGTILSKSLLGRAKSLLAKQLNAIGSHTHIKINPDGSLKFRTGEGAFDDIHRIEAEAIWMIGSTMGGMPETIDGFFCGGGTEANLQGLWIGREYLRKKPDPFDRGTIVIGTPLSHYSIPKAVDILGLDYHNTNSKDSGSGFHMVGMNEAGEMSIELLREFIALKYQEGFRRFLLSPTVGTSLMGSIDPIKEIGKLITELRKSSNANFYMHVDASFAGFTVPFVNPDLHFAFQVPEVMSVTVDGDKMGQLPYPAGVFLCRKNLQDLVKRVVPYVRGNHDDTVPGSRSCLAPICAWYLYQTEGLKGQKKYVEKCLEVRDYLVQEVNKKLPWVNILPCSPWVNFAPMEINFRYHQDNKSGIPEIITEDPEEFEKIAEKYKELTGILFDYQLRSDKFPSDPTDPESAPLTVYKICTMPHITKEHIDQFIQDLDNADRLWIEAHSLTKK